MFWAGVISIGICFLLGLVYYFLFVKFLKIREQRFHIEKLIITAMSVLLGVGIYFLQQGSTELIKTNQLIAATKEEIKIITQKLSRESQDPNLCGTGAVKLYTDILRGEMVHLASTSPLMETHMLGHLIYLSSLISEHNRWASFGIDVLKNNMNVEQIKIQQQRLSSTDRWLLVQAEMILECWENGTSRYDDNCI